MSAPPFPSPEQDPRPYRPAATLIVFREVAAGPPALLMIERAAAMRFAGGASAFPGGAVDAADTAMAELILAGDVAIATPLPGLPLETADLAARIAAVREALEETGLVVGIVRPAGDATSAAEARAVLAGEGALAPVLARFGWRFDAAALVPFTRWCPPKVGGFDTRFYLTRIDADEAADALSPDRTEVARVHWASAAAMLAAAEAGEVRLIFPTRRNLERLAAHGDFAAACADAARHPATTAIQPTEAMIAGERWLTIPAGFGYPVLGEPIATALRG